MWTCYQMFIVRYQFCSWPCLFVLMSNLVTPLAFPFAPGLNVLVSCMWSLRIYRSKNPSPPWWHWTQGEMDKKSSLLVPYSVEPRVPSGQENTQNKNGQASNNSTSISKQPCLRKAISSLTLNPQMVHYSPELCIVSSLCPCCNILYNVYIPPKTCSS